MDRNKGNISQALFNAIQTRKEEIMNFTFLHLFSRRKNDLSFITKIRITTVF